MCLGLRGRRKEEAHLSLGVRPQPGEDPGASEVGHPGVEFVSEDDSEGHALFRLIGGIAKHQTLQQGRGPTEQAHFRQRDNVLPT